MLLPAMCRPAPPVACDALLPTQQLLLPLANVSLSAYASWHAALMAPSSLIAPPIEALLRVKEDDDLKRMLLL
jgi:hypothetical protein